MKYATNVTDENGYISVAKFSGKAIVDVKGYFSNGYFKAIKLIFSDGSFLLFDDYEPLLIDNDEKLISYARYEQLRNEANES